MTKSLDTKAKIIEVATELFANEGYNGVSVRNIAKKADVNLASVNYHFNSKAHLYAVILSESRNMMEQQIYETCQGKKGTLETSMAIFDVLIKNSDRIRHVFSMITSKAPKEVLEAMDELNLAEMPSPGSEAILNALNNEFSDSISEDMKYWAVGSIFNQIGHTAIVSGTVLVDKICNSSKEMAFNLDPRPNVELSIKATLLYLESIRK